MSYLVCFQLLRLYVVLRSVEILSFTVFSVAFCVFSFYCDFSMIFMCVSTLV